MALFNKLDKPVFLKEDSDVTEYISKLKSLQEKAAGEVRERIEQEIKISTSGEFGENNIAFELKNSGMPMYILRDIHFEIDDLIAQIDFIVVTRKIVFVIECKNLIGNIEIDNGGNFIREYEYKRKRIREGIYSPITQNQRHLEVIKRIKKEKKSNALTKFMLDKFFDDFYKSIVVLANPKTILNDKYAKKEIKEKVIRADQLSRYIKDVCSKSKNDEDNDKTMKLWAEGFLELHTPSRSDYAKKYEEIIQTLSTNKNVHADEKQDSIDAIPEPASKYKTSADKDALVQNLKSYRLKQSREENIKAYYIFNDKQMMDLIEKMPDSMESLLKVDGFGEVKVKKYGENILGILNEFK
jgi:Superfamily II DNA helicase